MLGRLSHNHLKLVPGILAIAVGVAPSLLQAAAPVANSQRAGTVKNLNWQSRARWRHCLKKTSGTLVFNNRGVEFQALKGKRLRWSFEEVQTFKLSPHHFKLTSYENRRWHLPGERSFEFDIKSAVPPAAAALLARRVGKPVKNADPSLNAPAFVTLGARHPTRCGGTNGVLRFRNSGIDYVTNSGRGARSWSWRDIQTIANPDPYHFSVGGYLETFAFELKEPMTKELFDRLWNDVYARDLSGLNPNGGTRR